MGVGFGLTVVFGLLATIFGSFAVIFGIIGVVRARKGRATDGGMAVIGALAGVLAVGIGVAAIVSMPETTLQLNPEADYSQPR